MNCRFEQGGSLPRKLSLNFGLDVKRDSLRAPF
jgi:hypothetical protein